MDTNAEKKLMRRMEMKKEQAASDTNHPDSASNSAVLPLSSDTGFEDDKTPPMMEKTQPMIEKTSTMENPVCQEPAKTQMESKTYSNGHGDSKNETEQKKARRRKRYPRGRERRRAEEEKSALEFGQAAGNSEEKLMSDPMPVFPEAVLVSLSEEEEAENWADAREELRPVHRLKNVWTFRFKKDIADTRDLYTRSLYAKTVKTVGTVNSVEGFWSLYLNIKSVDELSNDSDVSLFKNDITPSWDDEANKNGGRWVFPFSGQAGRGPMEELWTALLMALVGEQFRDEDGKDLNPLICGALFLRGMGTKNKLCVWMREGDKKEIRAVGKSMRRLLSATNLARPLTLNDQLLYVPNKSIVFKATFTT